MPEQKKQPHIFDAETDSQLGGLHLVRSKRPLTPKTSRLGPQSPAGSPREEIAPLGGGQSPEPALVSKLIDFIKSI